MSIFYLEYVQTLWRHAACIAGGDYDSADPPVLRSTAVAGTRLNKTRDEEAAATGAEAISKRWEIMAASELCLWCGRGSLNLEADAKGRKRGSVAQGGRCKKEGRV